MKKLSILLCLLLVGCSNKVEQSTTSIEETIQPTTIIETMTETTEQIIVYSLYDNTPMYVEESVDSKIIDTLSSGEAITMLTGNSNFVKVRKENGLIGYVQFENISVKDISTLESEVAELESKVSELESKLAETSVETIVETTVEETTKETKPPKETVIIVVTTTPTPTPEPTPIPEHFIKISSVTLSLSEISSPDDVRKAVISAIDHKNCNATLSADGLPEYSCQLSPGTYTITWTGKCGTYYQTVTITE